jgi:hypothetical protein
VVAPGIASASYPGCTYGIVAATTHSGSYYYTGTWDASGCGPLDVTAILGANGGHGCKLLAQYKSGSSWINGAAGWVNFAFDYAGDYYLLTDVVGGTPERILSTSSCTGIEIDY